MCVRGVDDLCVLQFTLINAAGCALHRRTSRVIHRIELCFLLVQKVESRGNVRLALRDRDGGGGRTDHTDTPTRRSVDKDAKHPGQVVTKSKE